MVDMVAPGAGETNPSQTGGAGITLGAPVNGDLTPPVSQDAPPVDESDPVAVAQAALDKAKADKAAAAGEAPVVAPAQPQVEVVPSTQEGDLVIYDPTGDAALDMALGFIGNLGIPGNDPVMVAAANGDFSLLEAKLATFGDKAKGWEAHVALGKQAFDRQLEVFKADEAKKATEQTQKMAAIHNIAGGEAQWKTVMAWANTAATADEKAALDAMFDAGPIQAQMAARSVIAAHAEATGTTIKPANPAALASGIAPSVADASQLTRANYFKETDALFQKLGNRMDSSPEYAALRQKYFGAR